MHDAATSASPGERLGRDPGQLTLGGVERDGQNGAVGRANLNGTHVQNPFIIHASYPCGIEVHDNHLYSTSAVNGAIARARLDGAHVNRNVIPGAGSLNGVAVGPG